MQNLQEIIDFVLRNKAFFIFLVAAVGYILAKYRGVQKNKKISRLRAALKAVAESVEEFSHLLEMKDEHILQDPKSLKKTIAYNVSEGREELDEIIEEMETTCQSAAEGASQFSRLLGLLSQVLP
jgi:stalled ribosome rescue protein Dom34